MKWLFTIIPIIWLFDQGTKLLIKDNIMLHSKKVVVDGFINLTHVQNTGAAFGMFRDLNPVIRNPFFYGVSLLAFVILFYLFTKTSDEDWRLRGTLSLIMGGAIGNITDRIIFGSVTDFIDVYYKQYHWPSFNVADSCITVGVILLFIEMILLDKEHAIINGHKTVSEIEAS